ncbi:MAG: deoxyribose-phosphate aldolase [Aigarchaeota archaeon]|nr:deoxyribose-phosphate aldolase [Candidatus Pelearchaeum maunauluense]
MNVESRRVLSLIDHTNLRPEARRDDIIRLCAEAKRYGFASVCVNPYYVPLAARHLRSSQVKVCTVVGFPLGATLMEVKVYEARLALKQGADEIDMVINLPALKSGNYRYVLKEIRSIASVCKRHKALLKVIIECGLLSEDEKRVAAELVVKAGADFVKTSTGFGPSGASVEDVRLLKRVVAGKARVKAAGGIRTLESALAMIEAGADRIGTSSGASIAEELFRSH